MRLCYRSLCFPAIAQCPFLGRSSFAEYINTQFQLLRCLPSKMLFLLFIALGTPQAALASHIEMNGGSSASTCEKKFHQFGTINESDLYTLTRIHLHGVQAREREKQHKNINYLRKFT